MRLGGHRPRVSEPPPRRSRFGSLRSLSETQLTLQFSLSATYDSHALGVMGLAVGLAAAAIAAKDFLERWWWASLVGLFVAVVLCMVALTRRELDAGLDPSDPRQLYPGLDADQMDEVIVGNLRHTWARNHEEIVDKRNLIRGAILVIVVTAAVTAVLGAVVS